MRLPFRHITLLGTALALSACGEGPAAPSSPGDLGADPSPATDMAAAAPDMDAPPSGPDMWTPQAQDMGAPPPAADMAAATPDLGPRPWRWRATRNTQLHVPGPDSCLRTTPTIYSPGQALEVLSANTHWALVRDPTREAGLIRLGDFEELSRPADPSTLPEAPAGRMAAKATRHTWGADGCPAPIEEDALEALSPILGLAKFHDPQYRGWAVIDRQLGLAPTRRVEVPGWHFPWEAAVQIIKPLEGGFVTGGGVLIDPHHLLTVAHLGVDETYCYLREPLTGVAWDQDLAVCGNVASVTPHPRGVDVAIVELTEPEPAPFATLPAASPVTGQAFYTTDYSSLMRNSFHDGTVRAVGNDNAYCQDWPASTTFWAEELLISAGDSGGPTFSGDELIGLVHGERCRRPIEPQRHVFINVAGLLDWIAAQTAPADEDGG